MIPRLRRSLLILLALAPLAALTASPAQAASPWEKVYKVQVEYWFFDTDYYYWDDFYESTNQQAAQFIYALLMVAKNNGNLSDVASVGYWRYIPVDVRIIVTYRLKEPPAIRLGSSNRSIGTIP